MSKLRVFLTDDHTLFRQGIRTLLCAEPDIEIAGEASNAADAVERVAELRPDVVLLDISMPGLSSFQAIRQMHKVRYQGPAAHHVRRRRLSRRRHGGGS